MIMPEIFIDTSDIPDAYHKALVALQEQGVILNENTEDELKEIALTAVMNYPMDEPMISKYFMGEPYELERHKEKTVDGVFDFDAASERWGFTMHDRLVNLKVITADNEIEYKNQLDCIISQLRKDSETRKAVISPRQPGEDLDGEYPPVINDIQFLVRDNKLCMIMNYRSSDVIGLFMDLFVYALLLKQIAQKLNLEVGRFTYRCNCLHCYKKNYELLNYWVNEIKENSERPYSMCRRYIGNWQNKMEKAKAKITQEVRELKGE